MGAAAEAGAAEFPQAAKQAYTAACDAPATTSAPPPPAPPELVRASGSGTKKDKQLPPPPTPTDELLLLENTRGFLAHAGPGGKGAGRLKGNAPGALWTVLRDAVKARPKGAKCFILPEVRAQCLMVYV